MFDLSYALRGTSGAIIVSAALGLSLAACSSSSFTPSQSAVPQSHTRTAGTGVLTPL